MRKRTLSFFLICITSIFIVMMYVYLKQTSESAVVPEELENRSAKYVLSQQSVNAQDNNKDRVLTNGHIDHRKAVVDQPAHLVTTSQTMNSINGTAPILPILGSLAYEQMSKASSPVPQSSQSGQAQSQAVLPAADSEEMKLIFQQKDLGTNGWNAKIAADPNLRAAVERPLNQSIHKSF